MGVYCEVMFGGYRDERNIGRFGGGFCGRERGGVRGGWRGGGRGGCGGVGFLGSYCLVKLGFKVF